MQENLLKKYLESNNIRIINNFNYINANKNINIAIEKNDFNLFKKNIIKSRRKDTGSILKLACLKENIRMISYILKKCNLDEDEKYACFKWAIEHNKMDIVKYFTKEGLNDSYHSSLGLMAAIEKDRLYVLKYLIKNNFYTQEQINNALIFACYLGKLNIIKYLIEKCSVDIYINKNMPLRYAASRGYTDIVRFLASKGADIHAEEDYALKWAKAHNNSELIEYLSSAT